MRRISQFMVALVLGSGLVAASTVAAQPAQSVPSALLVFPYVDTEGGRETRIELVNLSGDYVDLQCFWVHGDSCLEIGFFLSLTPYQPMSWTATRGVFDPTNGTAAPPFFGTGELKCAVVAAREGLEYHNTIQGRAIVYGDDGQTVSYGAVGFRRLSPGPYTGEVKLNGSTYAQCPNRLHFQVQTDESLPNRLILVPCDQDLLLQIPTELTVQFLITNEFEQTLSASADMECSGIFTFPDIASVFTRATIGSATAQLNARGVQGPLLGLVIDAVDFFGTVGIAGNEPSFSGGRSATVQFPDGGR
jgi:hypothetical protein